MWSSYDEDILKNIFYKEIKENHKDILSKSSEENWIICVPRYGTIKNESDVHIDTILDHILINKNESKFCTLSKKALEIKNKRIYPENDQIFNDSVEVLFEETFYTEHAKKYTVWCIDRPLFMRQNCDTCGAASLENLHSCVDFLWTESSGHNVLGQIQKLCGDFEEFQFESLQSLKEEIGNVYSQCLQITLKNMILKEKCSKNLFLLENLKVSVETFMQFCMGKKLMYNINTLQQFYDAAFNKIIRNSKNMTLTDLNISNDLCEIITVAKCQLSKINNYCTVLDKINCVKRTFNIFYNSSEELGYKSYTITSDNLLQILVYLILKLNICNWIANLTFLKEFRLSVLDCSDEISFFITTLEAAITFLKSDKFLEISKNLIIDQNNNSLLELYDKICSGNFNLILEPRKVDLCHPLCTCEKCEACLTKHDEILNEKGQNLLIFATLKNNVEIVEFLLSSNFNANYSDCFGKTPLHYAAENGLQDVLLLLITYKSNVNALDNEKNTPLHLACDRGQENCVKALIYSCLDLEINLGNFQNETPIFLATRWGYFEIVKTLLENGASVCLKNNRNQSVYSLATNHCIFKLLKDFGRENSNNFVNDCKINISSIAGQEYVEVSYKVQHGVRPKNAEQFKKIDLLLKAIENNDLPLTCFYLGFSDNFNKPDSNNTKCHPLCNCSNCQKDQESFVKSERHPPKPTKIVNMCDANGNTPLHVAAKYGRTEILRILLDCGALPNISTYKTVESPLHLAVKFQRKTAVKELLKSGSCNVDIQDDRGNTPLFYACLKNDTKMVELLLVNGADCKKLNYENKTILQEVDSRNLFVVAKMLRDNIRVNFREDKSLDSFL